MSTSTQSAQMPSQELPDALFLERLEAFMQKSLLEVKAFSERECRPFEETRKYVAEWHCKHLFRESEHTGSKQVYAILSTTSQALESLYSSAGIHSFLVSINPSDDSWFLGGTSSGRDFWRGMRGGGDVGAKAFKGYCIKRAQAHHIGVTGAKKDRGGATASTLKAELYASMRSALRTASGIHNAEMKWSNHSRLDSYGVSLSGWPASIPKQNPSTLSVSQMRTLLDALEEGSMCFVKANSDATAPVGGEPEDFSWACEDDEAEHVYRHNLLPSAEQDSMMYLNCPSSPLTPEISFLPKHSDHIHPFLNPIPAPYADNWNGIRGTHKRRREDDDDTERRS